MPENKMRCKKVQTRFKRIGCCRRHETSVPRRGFNIQKDESMNHRDDHRKRQLHLCWQGGYATSEFNFAELGSHFCCLERSPVIPLARQSKRTPEISSAEGCITILAREMPGFSISLTKLQIMKELSDYLTPLTGSKYPAYGIKAGAGFVGRLRIL
jgi:hypothetical protein